jgi:uncharacterized membrane protein YozB (DUF420 family)
MTAFPASLWLAVFLVGVFVWLLLRVLKGRG